MDFAQTPPRRRCRPLPEHLRGRGDVDQTTIDGWCAEYARTHDPELKERIVAAHQWLVRVCARRLLRRNEQLDDLVQVGNIGLLKALDRYDPAFRVAFRTYASATIVGELRRHYRTVWMVRVPRGMQERHLAVRGAFGRLESSIGRTPTMGEVAAMLGLTCRRRSRRSRSARRTGWRACRASRGPPTAWRDPVRPTRPPPPTIGW